MRKPRKDEFVRCSPDSAMSLAVNGHQDDEREPERTRPVTAEPCDGGQLATIRYAAWQMTRRPKPAALRIFLPVYLLMWFLLLDGFVLWPWSFWLLVGTIWTCRRWQMRLAGGGSRQPRD